jgi:pyridoxamine 5'-phosphate oxidase
VLRGATRATACLDLHTDALSPKAADIANDPRVALHVWVPKARLQLRMRARAELVQGDTALFAGLPPEAQANYCGAAPGTALPTQATGAPATPERFLRILCHLDELDVLSLSTPHHRALFRRADGWSGHWIAP